MKKDIFMISSKNSPGKKRRDNFALKEFAQTSK